MNAREGRRALRRRCARCTGLSAALVLGIATASAIAQATTCQVEPFQGATRPEGALAHMRVASGSAACAIVNYGVPEQKAHPAERGRITKAPAHGSASFDAPRAVYAPEPGYVGRDAFAYEATARGQHDQPLRLKVHVQVTVTR